MKTLVFEKNSLILKQLQNPITEDGIIIQLEACGICGSDLQNISGKSCKPTNKLGHELSGIIIRKGNKIKNFDIGDRVFVHHHTSCGQCYFCNHGNETMCDLLKNHLEPCGLSEEFLVPKWLIEHGCVIKIPSTLTHEEAIFIEPLACCVRAWKKLSVFSSDSIAIFGMGSIGMLHAMLAKQYGIKNIFCFDPNKFRLNFCKKMNLGIPANLNDQKSSQSIYNQTKIGLDFVIVATSELSVLPYAISLLRKGGTILVFGEPPNKCELFIDFNEIFTNEITLTTTYAASNNDISSALELIASGKINVAQLILHKFPLDKAIEAINFAQNQTDTIKTIITKN